MSKAETLKNHIHSLVNGALKKLKWEASFAVNYPSSSDHGDYATNVALVLSKTLKRAAPDIGLQLVSHIERDGSIFERIEVSGSGFINFFLNSEYVRSQLKNLNAKEFGDFSIGKNKKVNIEFISANPSGPLTIGNARGAFFGDVLAAVLENAGYDVTREYYVNDAKTSNQIRELGMTVLGSGEAYKSEYLDKKIAQFKKEGFHFDTLDAASVGYMVAHSIQEDTQDFILNKLHIKFDKWFHEQTLFEKEAIVNAFDDLKRRKLIYEKDGAIWLNTTRYGDVHDQVLVRSAKEGDPAQPTYFLSDIAYHIDKFKRGYDVIFDILGADHQGHITRMEAIARMQDYKGKFVLLFTQLVRLKEKNTTMKVSKRLGNAVTLEWLLEQVGLDSARYFFLTKSIDTHMDFDIELAKTKSLQNPVFYIHYTHARLVSIIRKAKEQKFEANFKNVGKLTDEMELSLIKQLLRLPELLQDVVDNYQVHSLTHYLLSIAKLANSYYEKFRVLGDDKELTSARLCLIGAARNVIFKTLQLLGMSAPTSM